VTEPVITPPAAAPLAITTQADVPAVSAPAAADEIAVLKAEVARLGKSLGEVSQEAAQRRVALKASEDRAAQEAAAALEAKRAAGELGPVLEAREKDLQVARAELDRLKPLAERYETSAARKKTVIEAAIAEAGLPTTVKRGLEIALRAGEIDDAADLLADHRASVAPGAPKQPAPPAPAQGAAPSSPAVPLDLKNPSVTDLQKLKATNPAEYARIIHGQRPSILQSVSARLTGVRK